MIARITSVLGIAAMTLILLGLLVVLSHGAAASEGVAAVAGSGASADLSGEVEIGTAIKLTSDNPTGVVLTGSDTDDGATGDVAVKSTKITKASAAAKAANGATPITTSVESRQEGTMPIFLRII